MCYKSLLGQIMMAKLVEYAIAKFQMLTEAEILDLDEANNRSSRLANALSLSPSDASLLHPPGETLDVTPLVVWEVEVVFKN